MLHWQRSPPKQLSLQHRRAPMLRARATGVPAWSDGGERDCRMRGCACITNVTRLWLHIFRESCGHAQTQRGGIDEACLQKIAAVYVMYSTHLDSGVIATTCQGTCKNAWRTALASCMHTQFLMQGKTFQYTLDTHTPTRSWQSLRNDSCVGYCGAWGLPQHKTGWAERQARQRG